MTATTANYEFRNVNLTSDTTWTAELYKDGKHLGKAQDHGRGGITMLYGLSGAQIDEFKAHAATIHPGEIEPHEELIYDLLEVAILASA